MVEYAEILIYAAVFVLCGVIVWAYLRSEAKKSRIVQHKIDSAKAEGRFEPISLHPFIDLTECIGSGACIKACPEKDIIGLVNGQASVINATSCVGHGACFHACPVEAISLRIGTESRGVELPHVNPSFETNVKDIFIAGELGGMGLIKNSVEQGKQAVQNIAAKKKSKKEGVTDLIVIGAGPAGISAALTAKENGLSCRVLEQFTLGGTVYSFPRSKIVMTSPMDLPMYGKVKLYDTSKDELLTIWNEAISKNDIQITENTKIEKIELQEDDTFKVVSAAGEEYWANHVLIAIGRRGTPRKLGVPGEDLPKVFYRLLEPEELKDKDIVVVGGGDSAIESALLLMDQNRVTLSYRKEAFARIKPKNQEKIDRAMAEGLIQVVFNSQVAEIREKELDLTVEGLAEPTTLPNDLVYVFIGGELPIKFLENAGIAITKRFGYIVKKHSA